MINPDNCVRGLVLPGKGCLLWDKLMGVFKVLYKYKYIDIDKLLTNPQGGLAGGVMSVTLSVFSRVVQSPAYDLITCLI